VAPAALLLFCSSGSKGVVMLRSGSSDRGDGSIRRAVLAAGAGAAAALAADANDEVMIDINQP